MSGGLRALARPRLAVRCSSDGEVPFSHPKKGTLVRRGGRPGAPRALAVPTGPLGSAGPPQTAETIFSCILERLTENWLTWERSGVRIWPILASPGWMWRWPALGCAPAARRGGDLGGRRPCRERAQRGRGCAARRGRALGSRGDGRRGWDACMSSKLPSAYASRAANGGEGVLEGQPRTRMAFDK